MSGSEQGISALSRAEARRWLVIVDEDIAVANAAARLEPPRPGSAAYHLQQAAEKLLKALLVLNGEHFRRSHDLNDLVSQLSPLYPELRETLQSLCFLTTWGVAFRYPGVEEEPEPPPSIDDLDRVAKLLSEFAVTANSLVDGRSFDPS